MAGPEPIPNEAPNGLVDKLMVEGTTGKVKEKSKDEEENVEESNDGEDGSPPAEDPSDLDQEVGEIVSAIAEAIPRAIPMAIPRASPPLQAVPVDSQETARPLGTEQGKKDARDLLVKAMEESDGSIEDIVEKLRDEKASPPDGGEDGDASRLTDGDSQEPENSPGAAPDAPSEPIPERVAESDGEEAVSKKKIAKMLADGLDGVAKDNPLVRPTRPLLLIAVLVPDGFEADAIEKRIRIRQAIMAAMSRARYLPDHPKWMNHQSVDFPRTEPVTGGDAGDAGASVAKLVSDQFTPDGSPRLSLLRPGSRGEAQDGDDYRTLMRITRGEYGRVRVVYVNPGDLKRSFSRKEWEAYEVGLKLPIYWAFPEGGPWQRMMVWAKGALNQKMREKRKTLLKTAPSAAYTGYLWRHTIHELRQQFADRSRKLTVNVIGWNPRMP